MNRIKLIIVLTAATLSLVACKPAKQVVDTSCPGYRNVDFNRSQISDGGLAVMPVLGGIDKEQYRRPVGDAITSELRREFGDSIILSPSQVGYALNEDKLSTEYNQAISGYQTSGIVPKEIISKVGQSLNTRYILTTKLLSDYESNAFYDASTGLSVNIEVVELYVFCQVWDTKLSDVVWEGKGGAAKLEYNESDLVELTAKGITSVIGNKAGEGPCEKPTDIVEAVMEATTNGYIAGAAVGLIVLLGLSAI